VKKIQNEANFINKSLTTLGRIVRLISEKQPLNNIPYRESKLTRLLQVKSIINWNKFGFERIVWGETEKA